MPIHGTSKEALFEQIGSYSTYAYTYDSILSEKGKEELYKDREQCRKKINAYKEIHNIPEDDPKYFRKRLIEHIEQRIEQNQLPEFNPGDQDNRKTDPESATSAMEEFLGPEGIELYKLALEEEVSSNEFRHAVVEASTSYYAGAKWKERPIVIVAGPSGCGKSYAAKRAVETGNRFLPTDEKDNSGNHVIAADGGIAREVCQMRKLLIQVATNQGFTGIGDLQTSSNKILENIKHRVHAAAVATPGAGLVIPETFSKLIDPRNEVKHLTKELESIENSKVIFARVVGKKESWFKRIVAFMGSRRAWKTDDFEQEEIDLNKKDICESKAYNSNGFELGLICSAIAELVFKMSSKNKLSMKIYNDLILLKPDPNSPNGPWLLAAQNDEGARVISESLYNKWLDLPAVPTKPTLIDYNNEHSESIIITSAQIDFAIAQKKISKRLEITEAKLDKELSKDNPNPDRVSQLLNRKALLAEIAHFAPTALNSYEAIEKLGQKTQEAIRALSEAKTSKPVAISKSIRAFNKILTAIEKVSLELKAHNPDYKSPETEQANSNNCRSKRSELQSLRAKSEDNENLHMQATKCP